MPVAISNTANPNGVAGSGNVVTYSGASIGAADNGRIIVLCVGSELTSATINSATIDYGSGAIAMEPGELATQGAVNARVFWAHAPTGTTADFAITFGANPGSTQNHVAVYRVVEANIIPTDTGQVADTDADPITTGALTIPTDGGMIAICADAAITARTWTGITESLDVDTTAFRFSTGTSTTGGTPTVTVSGGNAEDGAISWVIFAEGAFFFPSLVDHDDSFFAPTVTTTVDIAPTLFTDDGEAFFAPTITLTLSPSLYDDTDTFFAPTFDQPVGGQDISPTLYDDTDTFFAPTVSPGTVDVAPSLYSDDETFFAPTVSPGAVDISPSLFDDTDQFFAPTVSPGAVDIAPTLYNDDETFFAPTVSPGAVNVSPSLYDDTDTFFAPTVSLEGGAQSITPSLFDDTDTFFAPTVTVGAVNIAPSLFDDIDTFFAPTVAESGAQAIAPSLFTDDDSFFTPAFIADQSISPTLFADDDVFFVPDISGGTGPRASTLSGTTRRNAQSNKERRNVSIASRGTPAIKER